MNLDLSLVKSAGAWCNKIWQVSRFLLMAHQKVAQRNNCQITPDNIFNYQYWYRELQENVRVDVHGLFKPIIFIDIER
jgi:hypothetical protein